MTDETSIDDPSKQGFDLSPSLALGISLAEACERAESELVRHAVGVVQKTITTTQPDYAREVAPGRFAFKDAIYGLRVNEAPHDSGRLELYAGPVGAKWETADFPQEEIKLEGAGRYVTLAIAVDRSLALFINPILETLKEHFESGYRRLQANVERILLEADLRVAVRLYSEIRAALDESASTNIALYALVDDERAMYMLDPPAIMKTLARTRRERVNTGGSPLVLTALLAKGWVKADETVAMHALGQDEPLVVRLADMHYTTSPLYGVAEERLYGQTAYVQPIVRDGRVKLIAAYPTDLKPAIEERLGALRGRISEIVREYEATTERLVRQRDGVAGRRWDHYIAEFLGRVLRGFVPD